MYNYHKAIELLSVLLYFADNKRCELIVWDNEHQNQIEYPEITRDNRGNFLCINDWYVVVTCENKYKYYINVTHDSIITMCIEVLKAIEFK